VTGKLAITDNRFVTGITGRAWKQRHNRVAARPWFRT